MGRDGKVMIDDVTISSSRIPVSHNFLRDNLGFEVLEKKEKIIIFTLEGTAHPTEPKYVFKIQIFSLIINNFLFVLLFMKKFLEENIKYKILFS